MSARGAAWLMVLALACGGTGSETTGDGPDTPVSSGDDTPAPTPATPPSSDWSGLDAPHPSWVACNADSECTTVEIGCCDHCNGGRVVPSNTQSASQVDQRYSASCPPDQACTERGCIGPTATCRDGVCALP